MPKISRGVTIPTGSGLRGPEVELTVDDDTNIPAIGFDGTAISAPTATGIDAPDVVGVVPKDKRLADSPSVSSSLPPKSNPPPEWLELPKIPYAPTAVPTATKDISKSVTAVDTTPSPPVDVPAEAEGPPKCPHCGAVLTQAQLDLKATGTKVLCSECFNMV